MGVASKIWRALITLFQPPLSSNPAYATDIHYILTKIVIIASFDFILKAIYQYIVDRMLLKIAYINRNLQINAQQASGHYYYYKYLNKNGCHFACNNITCDMKSEYMDVPIFLAQKNTKNITKRHDFYF